MTWRARQAGIKGEGGGERENKRKMAGAMTLMLDVNVLENTGHLALIAHQLSANVFQMTASIRNTFWKLKFALPFLASKLVPGVCLRVFFFCCCDNHTSTSRFNAAHKH